MRHETIYYRDWQDDAIGPYIEMHQAVTSSGRYAYKFDIIRKGNVIADCLSIDELNELYDSIGVAIDTYDKLACDIEITSDEDQDGVED